MSSIVLAYHLHNFGSSSRAMPSDKAQKSYHIMPIINCKKLELPLKTEVTYWLQKHNIELENLTCRDEVDMTKNIENLILVDHHVSPYHEMAISVIDHRPYDENSMLDEECTILIDEVGSCATLVADTIKSDVGRRIDKDILKLLYGPIVLDTINFSKDAKKVKELDIEMAEMIESILGIETPKEIRKKLFDELVQARADVSSLNSLQILSKDLKIISGSIVRVALPGVHVFEYPQMENAEKNLRIFAERENIDVIVLMGMKPKGNSVERMLAVIDIKNSKLYNEILNTVKTMENPSLNLVHKSDINFMGGKFFYQKNVHASRKQILPVIKELLNRY